MSSPRKNPDTATAVRPEQPVPAAARCGRSSWQIRCAAVVLLPVPGGPGWGFPVFTQGIWGKSCRKPWYSIKKKTWFQVKMFPSTNPMMHVWLCLSHVPPFSVAKNSSRWYNPDPVTYRGRQCDSKWFQITFAIHWLLSSFNPTDKISLHYPGIWFIHKKKSSIRYAFSYCAIEKSDMLDPWTPSNLK